MWITMVWKLFNPVNTLPSGHAEMRDYYPMIVDRSRISTFSYTTSCTCVRQLVQLTFASRLSTAWCRMLGSQVTNEQNSHDPLFLEPLDCNKGTTHSDTLSVFLHLQSWLCIGMFCKRTIFCVSYMRIHVLMSLIIVAMKVWTVTVTSPQLVHINNCHLLLVHWPHNFHTHFSSHLARQFL
jgi:hypothetical protein